MSRNTDGALQRRVALVVIAALAVNPSMMVAAGPPEPAPPAAVARVGSVMVESEPAGAAVYVDGQLTGQTPLQVSGLSAGDHRVRVVKGGYLENARVVSVGEAAKAVRIKLTRDAGARPELAAQLGGGGGGGGGGGSKLPLYLALAGGGGVAAFLLLKKDDAPANQPPTAGSFTASPTTGILNTVTTFTAAGASDPEGDALSYSWNFGDGTPAGTGATATHTYTTAATFPVTLTVTATGGSAATAPTNLVVKNLLGTYTGTWSPFGTAITATVTLTTQAGVNLSGTYVDSLGSGDNATFTGSVNATTRQVTLTFSFTAAPTIQFRFIGTPDAATARVMAGVANDINVGFGADKPWTLTRP